MLTPTRRPPLVHLAPIDRKLLEGDKIQPGHPHFGLIWINAKPFVLNLVRTALKKLLYIMESDGTVHQLRAPRP